MKIDTLIFSQYRSGTNYFKTLISQNSDLNVHNINLVHIENNIPIEEWIRDIKKTTHFVIDQKTLYRVDPELLLTAKKYIYYIRKNVIRHAISMYINALTDAPYKSLEKPGHMQLLKTLVENADESLKIIHDLCGSIIKRHRRINEFLLKYNLSPYTCYYEDFCEHPEKIADVLKYLDQEVPMKIKPSSMISQSTHYHKQLEELYRKQFRNRDIG